MQPATWIRLYKLHHSVEGTVCRPISYYNSCLLGSVGRIMTAVEASSDTIKASTVLSAMFALMLAITTGMVGWLFVHEVATGETIPKIETHQEWQDARLLSIEKRLDQLLNERR